MIKKCLLKISVKKRGKVRGLLKVRALPVYQLSIIVPISLTLILVSEFCSLKCCSQGIGVCIQVYQVHGKIQINNAIVPFSQKWRGNIIRFYWLAQKLLLICGSLSLNK